MFHRAAELMFEKYKVPALFLAKNAVCISQKQSLMQPVYYFNFLLGCQVLTSFASGRATSLVVDRSAFS
jgi:actin-related protein